MTIYNQVRKKFENFFRINHHEVVQSSSLVPEDSSLLFTNSGMVQFKDYFAGKLESPYKRAATIQKCVRAGGKHNDLDNVGYTNRHHTFFEMLGNFSFGDYFKEEAILFSWNFLTNELGIDKNRLYVTVYHTDDEAYNIWKKHILPERIIRISTNDNFWQVGDVGPCGPCSEIFYDYGDSISGGLPGSKNQDGARFTEIWNLVFMQNFINEGGEIIPLPRKNIDTGMGLERLVSVLEGTVDNYSTSFFQELIQGIASITNIKPSKYLFTANGKIDLFSQEDISLRIIADHIRSASFLIADGVLPSNEGRGYVLRRIIRRLLKYSYFAGVKKQFLRNISTELISQMGSEYTELLRAKELIFSQISSEEEKFMELLPRGVKVFEGGLGQNSHKGVLSGDFAFKLYDTYGFPLDITLEIAKQHGIKSIDEKSFERAMKAQKEQSKKSWKGNSKDKMEDLKKAIIKLPKTEFIGYEHTSCKVKVLYCDNGYAVFNRTVFYAESGGQIADTGTAGYADIFDVQNIDGVFVHSISNDLPLEAIDLQIDAQRRKKIACNHTATHLLHYVLRKKYGESLIQKGSLVKDSGFRFDFSYSKPLSLKDIHEIEFEVNHIIRQNNKISMKICTQKEASNRGAVAIFGEKYGEAVRVISVGDSIELCGGTHVEFTGEVGLFKITGQSAVASGIRRIEAVTGDVALKNFQSFEREVFDIKNEFKISSSVTDYIRNKEKDLKNLRYKIQELYLKDAIASPNYRCLDNKFAVKILKNSDADLRQVLNSMQENYKVVFNQKEKVFSFCLFALSDAKTLANDLQNSLGLQMKFGGSDKFISGGGIGIIVKEKFSL